MYNMYRYGIYPYPLGPSLRNWLAGIQSQVFRHSLDALLKSGCCVRMLHAESSDTSDVMHSKPHRRGRVDCHGC